MPLYEYRCPVCHRVFEELRRAGDAGDASCPNCGHAASRILSLSAFALKGNGCYANDYGDRRPASFTRDGHGTIKGKIVPVPSLARDPSQPRNPRPASPKADDAKEGA